MGILKPNNLTGLPLQLGVFTKGSPVGTGLPLAAKFTGAMIFISDASQAGYGSPSQGGAGSPIGGSPDLDLGGTVCVSNGTNWINVVNGVALA